jgi:hypothetical protein
MTQLPSQAEPPGILVTEWAGHTVEVLLRIYAHCIDGDDDRFSARWRMHLAGTDLARWPRNRSAYVPGITTDSGIRPYLAAHDQSERSGVTAGQRPNDLDLVGAPSSCAPSRIRTCAHGSGGGWRSAS